MSIPTNTSQSTRKIDITTTGPVQGEEGFANERDRALYRALELPGGVAAVRNQPYVPKEALTTQERAEFHAALFRPLGEQALEHTAEVTRIYPQVVETPAQEIIVHHNVA